MSCTVVGFKKIIRKSDKSCFYELHLLGDDHYVVGHCAFSVFVPLDRIQSIELLIADNLNILCCSVVYNRFGKIDNVVLYIE